MKCKMLFYMICMSFLIVVTGCGKPQDTEQVQTPAPSESMQPGEDVVSDDSNTGESETEPPEATGNEGEDVTVSEEKLLEEKRGEFLEKAGMVTGQYETLKKEVETLELTEAQQEDYRYFEPVNEYYRELLEEKLPVTSMEEAEGILLGLSEYETGLLAFAEELGITLKTNN